MWWLLAVAGHQPVPELELPDRRSEGELPHTPPGRGLLWPQGISHRGGTELSPCYDKSSLQISARP